MICYEAENDWGIQLFKSYQTYSRHFSEIASGSQLDYREYFLETQGSYNGSGAGTGNVFFQPCYANTAVAVDYSWKNNSPNATVNHVTGQTFQVSTTTGDHGLCYIDLLGAVVQSQGGSANQYTITDISNVYGVSLGAVVIWRNSGSGLTQSRWRTSEIQTYLTRPTN
jgi:hypothetical protein